MPTRGVGRFVDDQREIPSGQAEGIFGTEFLRRGASELLGFAHARLDSQLELPIATHDGQHDRAAAASR